MAAYLAKDKFFTHARTSAAAILVLFIFLFSIPAAARPLPETQTITCFGESRIYNDITNARNAAISQALGSTVQTAASRIIPAADISRYFEAIAEVLTRKRDSFIPDYRILREYNTEKFFHVLVEATVSIEKMKEAFEEAEIKLTAGELPSVLLMIAEKNIDDIGFNYWWKRGYGARLDNLAENIIKQVFAEKDFTIISPDRQSLLQKSDVISMNLGAEPADYQAAMLGRQVDADLVIVGQATAEAMSNRMGDDIRTFRGEARLHVLDTKTGKKLTTIAEHSLNSSEDPQSGSRNALSDASYNAASRLAERVISLWRDASDIEGKFVITVYGQRILPHLERLRSVIRKQPGVLSLGTIEMTSKQAKLAVDYDGTAQELANNLLIQSFEGFGINIMELSTETMDIELIDRLKQ